MQSTSTLHRPSVRPRRSKSVITDGRPSVSPTAAMK